MSTLWKISGEWPTDCDEIHDETLMGTVWINKHTGREATITKVVRINGAKNPIAVLDDGNPEERWNSDFMIKHWFPHPQVPDADEDNDAELYLAIIGGNMTGSDRTQRYLKEWREWRDTQ